MFLSLLSERSKMTKLINNITQFGELHSKTFFFFCFFSIYLYNMCHEKVLEINPW